MEFQDKLRQARRSAGISQGEAAKGIGVSLRTYKAYELGESRPRNRQIYQRIADLYGLNINYLLTQGEEFVFSAAELYGSGGRKEARALVEQVIGLFSGGELSEADRDEVMEAIQQAYWEARLESRNKKNASDDPTPEQDKEQV